MIKNSQLGSANPTPSPIVDLVPFNSHAICTPMSSWLCFPALVHSVNVDLAHWSYIGVTQGALGRLINLLHYS